MPMAGLPFLGLVVAITLALVTAYMFLRRTFSFRVFLLLEAILAIFITAVVFPQSIDFLMGFFRVGVRSLFILTVGVLGAYLLIYGLYVAQTRQEKMMIKLIQEVALLRYQIEHRGEGRENNEPMPKETSS
jgi:hypothetical protein